MRLIVEAIVIAWLVPIFVEVNAQESPTELDKATLSQFNRESELFLFRQESAISLNEVASRDYPPIEFPAGSSGKRIEGVIVDHVGNPAANVAVLLLKVGLPGCLAEVQFGTRDVLIRQVTAADGRFVFELPILPRSDSVIFRVLAVHPSLGVAVETLFAEDFAPFPDLPKWNDLKLELHPAQPLFGLVLSDGQPVPDAEVCMTQLHSSQSGFLRSEDGNLIQGLKSSSDVVVRTNPKGEFRLDAVPTRGKFLLRVRHERFATECLPIVFSDRTGKPSDQAEFSIDLGTQTPDGSVENRHSLNDPIMIKLVPGTEIRGQVLNNGEACPEAFVLTSGAEFAKVDSEGRFSLRIRNPSNSSNLSLSAYANCHPFVPGSSLIATVECKPESSKEYRMDLRPAVLVTGRVFFHSDESKRQSWVALKHQSERTALPPYFRFDDAYWAIASRGTSTIMLYRQTREGTSVLMSLTEDVHGYLFRFQDLHDEQAIRLVVEAVDGSGNRTSDSKFSAMKFTNLNASSFSMIPVPVEEGKNPSCKVTLSEDDATVVFRCTRPPNDNDPFGSSGYLMIRLDSSYRNRTAPLQVQLNRNVLATFVVDSPQTVKPRVRFSVSESLPPYPSWEAVPSVTDSDGHAEFFVNPFALASVQVVSIDEQPVNAFPIQASPSNRYQYRMALGERSISGRLLQSNGASAAKRMIYLWSMANPTSPLQWTNSGFDGSFRFAWLPEGEYRIQAIDASIEGLSSRDPNAVPQVSQIVTSGKNDLKLQFGSQ